VLSVQDKKGYKNLKEHLKLPLKFHLSIFSYPCFLNVITLKVIYVFYGKYAISSSGYRMGMK
jgi:hypothetical protein